MSFPRYAKYKNSGVEWLGEVPEHWAVWRIKYLTESVEQGWSPQCENSPAEDGAWGILKVGCVNGGHFNPLENKALPPEIPPLPRLALSISDILISRANTRELVGSCAVIEKDYPNLLLCDKLYRLRLNQDNCLPEYLALFLSSSCSRGQIELAATGASNSMLNIGQSTITEMPLPLPEIEEQYPIIARLGCETYKIDALIEEQQRLIELLKEKRHAVISHAVTKGLNPKAPMKPSGIEWLGDVPAHWEVLPLKRDLSFLTSGSRGWAEHYSDFGPIFLRIGNLTRDSIDLNLSDIQRVTVPPGAEGTRTRVQPDDLLFSITAFLGSVAVVPNDLETAYVSQHVALARLRGIRLIPDWVGYVTLSDVGQTYLQTQGYGGTKVQLSLDDIGSMVMTVPPLEEQRSILAFIRRELDRINDLAVQSNRIIRLLEERRSALISAAVTGKIDVRNIVAQEVA